MNDHYLLELEHVAKRYEEGDPNGPPVLKDITLQVRAGETLAIVGPSGSGKSTLLNIIGMLDRPSAGTVRLEGEDHSRWTEQEAAAIRNRKIGFVFQEHHLLPQCTVLENVLIPTLARKKSDRSKQTEDLARELLREVGMEERMGYFPGQLSGGEKQRAAVVRALINQPPLVLADEPTGSLDKASSEKLADLLVELNRRHGITLIMVTHSQTLAGRMGRVLELSEGMLRPWGGGK
jgi:ABC-type lipoprotein export system ATPase subunit